MRASAGNPAQHDFRSHGITSVASSNVVNAGCSKPDMAHGWCCQRRNSPLTRGRSCVPIVARPWEIGANKTECITSTYTQLRSLSFRPKGEICCVRPAWARSWRCKFSRELTTGSEAKRNCVNHYPIFLSCPSAKCRKRRLGAGLARVREGTKWVNRNLQIGRAHV